jgi:CDGSH-type Zn-finger protein
MSSTKAFKVTVTKNGPYLVNGGVPIGEQHIVTNPEGESLEWRAGHTYPTEEKCALCRCGHSHNKPFCDGTHSKIGFDGTETASREPFREQANRSEGPGLTLLDAEKLCSFARFCDTHGQIWNLIDRTDEPEIREVVRHQAGSCPSGRLVVLEAATGKPLEPHLPPSIGLVVDAAKGVLGPLWVRGGIPVTAADGTTYEVRNRVALCRCGASSNKPFCDGSHASIGFTAES